MIEGKAEVIALCAIFVGSSNAVLLLERAGDVTGGDHGEI